MILTFVFSVGFPMFAIALGLYGLYRLSRVSSEVPGAARWRRFGIVAVVLVAVFWGMLGRILSVA